MKTIQRMFELNLTPKEVVWGKRILAVVILPVLVFYTTSMNFIFLGMMNAQAADGSGTMTVNDDKVTAGGVAQNFKFTFDPNEDMDGGSVRIEFPSPFPTPSLSGGDGGVTVEGKNGANLGTPTSGGRLVTVPVTTMSASQYFIVNYNVTSTMPATIGNYEFTTESKLSGGSFRDLGSTRQASVEVEAGVVASYAVSTPSGVKVGNDFSVTVTPKDGSGGTGNTTTGGTVTISATGGSGSLDGDTSKSTASGAATATLRYSKAESITIHVTDSSNTGDSSSFAVAGLAAPTFSSPGSSTNDSTPLINWSDVSGSSVTYAMDLVASGTCDSGTSFSSPLHKTPSFSQYQVASDEALLDETTYCVKVAATDSYGNSVDGFKSFNLLTVKPATPSAVTIEEVGSISTSGHPANTINIYNNESVSVKVTHASGLTDGKVYVEIKDGLNNTVTGNVTITGAEPTTVSGINASSLQQGAVTIKARVEDSATNSSNWSEGTTATKDTNPPAKPSAVSFVDNPVNIANQGAVNISVTGESGTEAYYSVGAVSDHFIMSGATTISPDKDMSSLADGTLTASVYLVDSVWNHSSTKTGTVTKDAAKPNVALTYSPNHAVKDADTMNVTATFTESMKEGADAPTIAVDYADANCADLSATPMAGSSASWTYGVNVPTCDATTTATVTISGQDLAGNSNNAATSNTFTVDNVKPTVTGTVLPNPSAAGTLNVNLTFSESMDQTVAPTVRVVTAGNAQTLVVTGSYANATTWTGTTTVSSGDANGTATLKASTASDIAGNMMDANINVATTLIDTTGPTFTIASGEGVDVGPVKTDTIIVTVSDSGAGGVSQFYGFSSDSTCNASDDISAVFTSGGSGFNIAGNHTDYLCVKATDAVGNTSYQTVGQLNTDNTAPILSPVHIVSNNTTSTSNAATGNTVTLTFISSETIQTPTVTIAGHAAASVTNVGNAWTATYTMVSGDTEGAVSFTVDFSDIAGNAGTQVTATTDASSVTFDNSAPSVSAVVSPATSDSQAISVSYTASDSGLAGVGFAKLYYRIDGGSWTVFDIVSADDYQAAPGAFSFIAPQTGNYDFYVQVKDNAGNESAIPSGDSTPHDLTDARPTTVYVCPSGACSHVANWDAFNTIQAGIDAIREASGNTVNVATGTYTENVNVNKSITLAGTGTVSVNAASAAVSVFNVTASSVSISGFTVSGATGGGQAGIFIGAGVASCNISNNALTGNFDGVWLGSGSNLNTLSNNTLSSNYQGFEVYISSNNTFTSNTANSNTSYGFKIDSGDHNTFTSNTASSNSKYGFYVVTGDGGGATNSTFTNNTANSNTQYGIRINGGSSYTLTGNTFNSNALAGLRLKDNITTLSMQNNIITSNPIGIDIDSSVTSVATWTVSDKNNISGNTTKNISNAGTGTLNAIQNWWGSNQRSTIEGKLLGSVNFTPWYMEPGMTTLSSSDTTGPTAVLTNSISGRTEVSDPDNVTITATFSDVNRLDTGVNPTITISNGGVAGASMTATTDLNIWTYLWNVPSGDFATASVTIAAKDIVGNNAQAPTGVNSYTIDNTAPTSTLSGTPGNPTNATALDVTVGGAGVVTYKYHLDGGSYGSAIPIATKITDSGLAAGSHTLYAKGIDAAGNEQTTETTHTWTIDTTAPSVALSYSVVSPVKAGTETITATYSENVKTGETPQISIDQPGSTDIANVAMTIGADRQHWTYTYTVNTANGGTYIDGTATVSLSTNHDEAGNPAGSPSNSTFVIDTSAPVATLNALTPNPSNHNTPAFTGNVTDSASVLASIQYRYQREAGAWSGWNDVTITDGALDEAAEDFSFETTTLIDGNYTIEVKGTDRAGNESNSASDTFSIDIVPPAVSGANIAVTGNTGTGGKFKRGNTVQVAWNNTGSGDNQSGIASVSVSFAEFGGGTVAATNTAGVWSASYALANDINLTGRKVSVTAVDTATNSTTTADDATFDVDTQNPAAPSIDMSDPVNDANKAAITLAGSGDAGGTLNYSIASTGGGGPVTGTIAIDETTGSYSKTDVNVSTLLDGTLTATVYVTDTAGNIGSSITDTSAKDVSHPTITDVNSGHADGSFKAGAVIDIDVTFSENVTSTSVTVNLDSSGSCSFLITDSASGTCDYTVLAGQNSADLTTSSISGTIADQHGNAMTVFTPATNLATHKAIIVDTVAPAAPTVTAPAEPITVNADNYSLQGAAEANALVKVYRDGTTLVASQQLTGEATAYSISVTLNQDTTNNFTAKATDAAGNEGAGNAAPTITEDSTAPSVDAGANQVKNALFVQDATTSDTFGPITYAWNKQSGTGTVTFSAATSEDTDVSASTDGTYVIRLTVTDAAGNSNFDEFTLTWDTTAPTSAASSEEYDRAGGINVNFSTGADLSGVAQVQLWYKFGAGGTWTNTGQTSTAASGTFTFTPSGDGTYYFATKAIDNATNQEADPTGSGDDSTIYDTVDPGAPTNFAVTSGAPYNTWTTQTATTISWTASSDATSGLRGFSYKWDNSSTADLPNNMSPTDGSIWVENETIVTNSKTGMTDGLWYFHIQPRDNAENYGVTTTYGPFKIDTTDPSISHSTVSSETAGVDIHVSANVTDGGSGVKNVHVFYKHHGDGSFTEQGMTCDGSWHCTYDIPDEENSDYDVSYYIKALDNVDNDSSTSTHTVDIIPAALDHFTFIYPTSGTRYAGTWFTTVVEARDQFNNVADQFNGASHYVSFSTDEGTVSVFVNIGDGSGHASDGFDQGVWAGQVKFGTGGTQPSGDNIRLTATENGTGGKTGSVTMNTSGVNFGTSTAAGSVEGAQNNGQGAAPEGAGAEGTPTPQVLGEESPTGGEQATPASEGAQNPWRQAIPYALGGTLLLSGIWLWIKRRGGGVGGSTPTILGMMFSSLKTAASKIRMFLW